MYKELNVWNNDDNNYTVFLFPLIKFGVEWTDFCLTLYRTLWLEPLPITKYWQI